MSTYEIDDDLVRRIVNGEGPTEGIELMEVLRTQLPIPVPVKIGAVITTTSEYGIRVLVRVLHDNVAEFVWAVSDPDVDKYLSNGQIGRIVTVLSPGVNT